MIKSIVIGMHGRAEGRDDNYLNGKLTLVVTQESKRSAWTVAAGVTLAKIGMRSTETDKYLRST